MKKSKNKKLELIKTIHHSRPDTDYYLPEVDKKLMKKFLRPNIFQKSCQKVCTKTITILPKQIIRSHTGVGFFMINVDGYRYINAYVISSPRLSTLERGFTLEISFSVNPFVIGVGVVGEANNFFNFDNYYNTTEHEKKIINCATSDQTSTGVITIGGVDLTHILRVPVMGPFIRASAFNEGIEDKEVEVKAYLTT